MVKKKRQSDPGGNEDDSTESCEENVKSACPHVAKAVDLTKLKRTLKIAGFDKECSECKKINSVVNEDPDYEEDLSLWMCLRCGSQLCGRRRNKHALNHFNTPHSDCHALTANTTSWEVYCYNCNNEVTATSSKKLHECIEYLKKQAVSNATKPLPPIELFYSVSEETLVKAEPVGKGKEKSMALQRVRGLSNLGNTCFFNSVMQCLGQTPYLLNVLQEMAIPGEKFLLPGGTLKLKGDGDDGKEVVLPPIAGELAEWGPLTRTLAETLSELQSGEGGVYNPRKLLSALVNKLPQFGGGDQHDSHELLRHLLEAVRSEDLRRYQSVILNSLGMSQKVDPSKVDGEVKQKVKFYGQQASDTMLRPEQVFRGFLVSTLECQDCLHTSDRAEYFLDLSLPVATSPPQPPALQRRKTPNEENNFNAQEDKPSKHKLKKQRIAAYKAARNSKGTGHSPVTKVEEATAVETNGGAADDAKSSSDSDADIEDNLEDPPRLADTRTASVGTQAVAHTAANFAAYLESGYNSDKVISSDSIRTSPDLHKEKSDSTPENLDKDKPLFIDNSTSTSAMPLDYKPLVTVDNLSNPDSGVASPETTKHNSTETVDNVDSPINGKELGSRSSLSSDINLESPQKTSPDKNEFERPVSRIDFAPEYSNEVVSRGITPQGRKNLLEYNGDAASFKAKSGDDSNTDPGLVQNFYNWMLTDPEEKENKPCPSPVTTEPEIPTVKNIKKDIPEPPPFMDRLNHTHSRPTQLTTRYVCEEDECSIQSCLSQFTALELLTGNNKVGCETCTTRANGKDGKTVYTNATKRFLVSSPPAILILHLKRFQLGPRCMFRKMSKHVDFPTILDLAPFCAMEKVRKLPNVAKHQAELIYSLYGVVEHSGGMHGGHYVAYVKVRPSVKPGDPRWWFLPKGGNISPNPPSGGGDTENESESDLSGYESGEGPSPMPEAPAGKWYYVSDSMVSEVSEDKVLKAQAYLLFYERIF